jgi:hypothetical protein
MTYQELVVHLQNPQHVSKGMCEETYKFMEPVLKALHCRKISPRMQDARIIMIFNGAFRALWNIEHQHPVEYWKRLEQLGAKSEFEEFAVLKQRKAELKAEWKRVFAVKRTAKDTSEKKADAATKPAKK